MELCSPPFQYDLQRTGAAPALHLHRTSRPSTIIPPAPLINTLCRSCRASAHISSARWSCTKLLQRQPHQSLNQQRDSVSTASANAAAKLASARQRRTQKVYNLRLNSAPPILTSAVRHSNVIHTPGPARLASARSSDQPLVPVRASDGLVGLNGTADYQRQTAGKASPTK
ncbi:hypothetical protein BGZ61DRAFT_185979 [Ilyonectria robusta]|uniref:uncharacterized protein n=1 Tax=Ilyonectria robusta TaxID=1079257 RepID=UPI001E8E06D6|nr:uncharacterized protein BGZ61DRAFT_185979 [Ilyonectria robusta]KAH8729675.1 hypothetical protein BGZ61DRAFT_185979 [Ilyonectria robusta]